MLSARLTRLLASASGAHLRVMHKASTVSRILAPSVLPSAAAGSFRSFHSSPLRCELSSKEARETRRVEVKQQPGDKPQYAKPDSDGERSPCAAWHDMSDEEYFDPRRPLRWLVAMDFSYNAWRALRAAKQLMRLDRKDTLVVFAVPPVPFLNVGDDSRLWYPPELIAEAVDKCVKQMESVHEECRELMGYYSCEVSEPGDARELVLMRLEKKGAAERIDYAVCGQRGKSRLLNIILGSVAVHLVHYAPTSVVVVK